MKQRHEPLSRLKKCPDHISIFAITALGQRRYIVIRTTKKYCHCLGGLGAPDLEVAISRITQSCWAAFSSDAGTIKPAPLQTSRRRQMGSLHMPAEICRTFNWRKHSHFLVMADTGSPTIIIRVVARYDGRPQGKGDVLWSSGPFPGGPHRAMGAEPHISEQNSSRPWCELVARRITVEIANRPTTGLRPGNISSQQSRKRERSGRAPWAP
ncbi:hypothetical protein BaRGS_00040461 [Batillaria attramentaria]|uniref:Uncharacterized protein n=1 Tax=Batillaria attramentaria TaxID=370345 RepID=A0ABD0J083_9CAEN